ncbi:type I-E CRISPR-associated protein Cse2/CasB [Peterkaempfera sp. SMS 1(5)a]|uniref:type I-E CRISPR-associated protein Cse2/CasB n=1 Tax=Peterkaempfera podocarpi TaxID=3232308 RepID=UPI0036721CC9
MSTTSPPAPAPTGSETRRERMTAFVAAVTTLCEAPGARADLRSGLGRPVDQCGRMHRYLAWRVPQGQYDERAYYAVAALIAARPRAVRDADGEQASADPAEGTAPTTVSPTHDREQPDTSSTAAWHTRPNLGDSLALAVRNAKMKEDSAETRLRLLTRQSTTSVHPRLPALIRHLQTSGITVDWAVLLDDLSAWDLYRDRIATRWLQSFYRTLHSPRATAPADEENVSN